MSGVLRFSEVEDAAGLASYVLARSLTADLVTEDRFLRQVQLDPNFRKEGCHFAFIDEEPVGCCISVARRVPVEGQIIDQDRGYLWVMGVLPEFEGKGIGSELLRRAEEYLRSAGKKVCMASCYSPGYFWPGVDVKAYSRGLSFLLNRGYEEVYRPISCQTCLLNLAKPSWVNDFEVKAEALGIQFSHDPRFYTSQTLRFARTEFGPDWAKFFRDSVLRQLDGDLRTGTVVAVQGGEVLGFAHFDGERFGPIGIGQHSRGKGLGQILMWKALERQRAAGFENSWFMWSDDKTLDRLYRHAGFEIVRRFALLRKVL